ncbi:polysaccharide lyase [Chitiniphilus purpureus]|uniref:Polysaccharide lyase n=1 Tax=Chitiniphilus purpureus TaxID=2981137 RepID=A0ABY6DQL7_9NEIS|nr:polysaccharide lyase [Chitiniphilus sp. CD1]UXY14203.1 polysaccharide lyase [Chitiniphilus sp. CD1]
MFRMKHVFMLTPLFISTLGHADVGLGYQSLSNNGGFESWSDGIGLANGWTNESTAQIVSLHKVTGPVYQGNYAQFLEVNLSNGGLAIFSQEIDVSNLQATKAFNAFVYTYPYELINARVFLKLTFKDANGNQLANYHTTNFGSRYYLTSADNPQEWRSQWLRPNGGIPANAKTVKLSLIAEQVTGGTPGYAKLVIDEAHFHTTQLLNSKFGILNFTEWTGKEVFPSASSLQIQDLIRRVPRGHALKSTIADSELEVSEGVRAEVKRSELAQKGDEQWFGFSTYVPSDWVFEPVGPTWGPLVAQWHSITDPGEGSLPPSLALVIKHSKWSVEKRWDNKQITVNTGNTSVNYQALQPIVGLPANILDIEKGVWTDWAFHVKWDWRSVAEGGQGFVRVYKNQQKIIEINEPNMYNNIAKNYFKAGLYDYRWNPVGMQSAAPHSRTIFLDEFHIMDENGSLIAVSPSN